MRSKRGPLGLLVLTAAFLALALGASAAQADTGDIIEPQNDPPTAADGFQAGTCISDEPVKCSPQTPDLFFKQAGGHPPIGFTQYIIRHEPFTPLPSPPFPPGSVTAPLIEPIAGRSIKTLRVDLPAGLTINPQATEQCTLAEFENKVGEFTVPLCKPGTIVGREEVTLVTNVAGFEGLPKGFVIPPDPARGTKVPVYNLIPKDGEPARFGFVIGGRRVVFIQGEVAWDADYHASFKIEPPPPSAPFSTLVSRLVNIGTSGDGSYITNPTTCFDPDTGVYSTFFRAESVEEPNPTFPVGSTPFPAGLPEGVEQEGCSEIPFTPFLFAKAGTAAVDSPAAPEIEVELPFEPDKDTREQSHVRNADLVLPPGMGLNPAAAPGLAACTDAQFGKGTKNDVTCPEASKVGTVAVETPPLPPGSLAGNVYLGQQLGSNPESGEMYRIFINPVSERFGIDVRLIGNIKANKETGQLTTTLKETPQVPFETVTLSLDPGKGLLTSPPTCGSHATTSQMEPWARPGTIAEPDPASFELTEFPGGGSCPATLGERPFAPSFKAGPTGTKAGAYKPFELDITRSDGQQEIRRVDVDLPPGMVAKLKGVEYCPEASIDAAGAQSGAEVLAKAACPDDSFVGTSDIASGSGATPLVVKGNVYLAGPYKGAPVSLVFITSAVAGPFDLGNVVVRVALNIDPETAEVHAVSDPIPYVFGGVKLDIRAIDVSINRRNFTLNPTTCRRAFPISAGLFGGGSNPADPASWFESKQSNGFRASECKALKFKPKFYARIFGGENQTKRAKNPKFRAILDARKGDANLRRAAFILPRATILDQSHIKTICTRVQLAANECPKNAIYGHARATSPLLEGALKGPVYLTSSDNELPDLLVDLRGQVPIRLRGVISSERGRLKTVFAKTPDVAVNKFILTMKGGERGLLINSRNLCARQTTGFLNLRAQNSRRLKEKNLRLNIPACRGGKQN
jgi:hypothetical protein